MNYWASPIPGAGRRTPRADAISDAGRISLNGTWRFRLSPTAHGTGTGFLADDFDDSGWDPIQVPSHWVLEEVTPLAGGPRRSLRGTPEGPLYTNTALPIPLDPPHVPHENPTGDYRLGFDAPEGWARAVLRFQGVDSCAKVWLNGEDLGFTTGSRLPTEFEAALRPGRNVLCVRVHRWSAGTYLEDQDMWWLPGIFRDVELLERPVGGIDDHHVHADYAAATGRGTLRVDAVTEDGVSATVEIPELGISILAGETVDVEVEPWSADSPRLYRGVLRTHSEAVALAIGFRHIDVDGGVLRINGVPVRFRGVNRHEHDPRTGRTLDRETMVRDIELMKRNNIDAVRTSHYPPHPEFLRLCDEYGLWVIDECDLETHGFIYAGWNGNPPAEAEWLPALQDRIERMVERDKNHPSVVIWSMANESWTGENFTALREWIRDRDPHRPVLYERDPSYRDSDFYSLMYPSLELLEQIGRREEPRPENITDDDDDRRRRLPFILVEYAHAMGNGPGSLQDYRRILNAHDRIVGGFVWEWIDHGFELPDGGLLHGGGVAGYRPNGGRYCLDGLLFSDRSPSPGLAELAKAYEPVEFDIGESITLRNLRHAADTADLELRWRVEQEGIAIAHGVLDAAPAPAGGEVTIAAPGLPPLAPNTETWLTVEATLREATAWAPEGHIVAWAQHAVSAGAPEAESVTDRLARPRHAASISVGPLELDSERGDLRSLGGIELAGPWVDAYRAPIENDRGQGGVNDLAGVWTAVGLDRMLHRTDSVVVNETSVQVSGRSGPAAHAHGIDYEFSWTATENSAQLTTRVEFTGPWTDTPFRNRTIVVPRLGVLLRLPGGYDEVEWFGRGPGESYVDSSEASRVGRYLSRIDDLQVPYPVPEENGNHHETRWVELRGPGLPTLRVDAAERFGFTARRWTSHDLERARSPRDLRDSGHVWLNLDHAQQGLGSASVGPALPERYRIPLTPTQWSLRFSCRRP